MATPFNGLLPLANDTVIDSMTNGYRWNSDSAITFSFSDGLSGEFWIEPELVEQQINLIFDVFGYYTSIGFEYLGNFSSPLSAAAAGSNINISIDGEFISDALGNNVLAVGIFPSRSFAQAYLGEGYYQGAEGDIFLNINSPANEYGYAPGDAGFSLALHEIGHALGLKHPHDDGGTARPTFDESGIAGLSIDWLTVMSYEDDYNWNLNAWDPATPMILDVIALQYLYGANTSTNAGDSLFDLSPNTNYYITIYDASGNDTLSVERFTEAAHIEVPNYTVSQFQVAPFGLVVTSADWQSNLSPHSLAWILGRIEKVIGSAFGDVINGSDQGERIEGRGGNDELNSGNGDDYLVGGIGNDTIDGGEGSDTAQFTGSRAAYTVTMSAGGAFIVSGPDGTDTLRNVELAKFDDQTVQLDSLVAPRGSGTLYLSPGNRTYGPVPGGDVTNVFGSNQAEKLTLASNANVVFDPSFVRGNDEIVILGNSSNYNIAASVAGIVITSATDAQIRIPAFGAGGGLKIQFDNAPYQLSTNNGGNTFQLSGPSGVKDITATAAPVGAGNNAASIDVGTANVAANRDAGTGSFTFTDDAEATTNVNITNFTSDDKIIVTNAVSNDYSFSRSFEDINDLVITYTDANTGATNRIVIQDVLPDAGAATSLNSATTLLGFTFMTFA